MTGPAALQRLLTWLSPAFPVGAFAWSQGLETAIADGRVTDAMRLRDWIVGVLAHGALKTDAILLAHGHRGHADAAMLAELADLGLALAGFALLTLLHWRPLIVVAAMVAASMALALLG